MSCAVLPAPATASRASRVHCSEQSGGGNSVSYHVECRAHSLASKRTRAALSPRARHARVIESSEDMRPLSKKELDGFSIAIRLRSLFWSSLSWTIHLSRTPFF